MPLGASRVLPKAVLVDRSDPVHDERNVPFRAIRPFVRHRISPLAAGLIAGIATFTGLRWIKRRLAKGDPENGTEEKIDEAGMVSSPASDLPGWTLGGGMHS